MEFLRKKNKPWNKNTNTSKMLHDITFYKQNYAKLKQKQKQIIVTSS